MEEAKRSYWRTPTCKDKSTRLRPVLRDDRSLPFTCASPLRTRSLRVSSRRCTRVGVRALFTRATTEFVGHAVDRGESCTRGLNVIGRWLQTTLLERCSTRPRLIPRVTKSRIPTYIHVLCRYDYLDRAAISLHYIIFIFIYTLNLVGLSRRSSNLLRDFF